MHLKAEASLGSVDLKRPNFEIEIYREKFKYIPLRNQSTRKA